MQKKRKKEKKREIREVRDKQWEFYNATIIW